MLARVTKLCYVVAAVAGCASPTSSPVPGDAALQLPATAAAIVAGYEATSASLLPAIRASWTDETLQQSDEMYGDTWKRGLTLTVLICHQTHHRGQMTVLMRQAGLKVPGIYGPAREEWAGMGLAPPEV